jgi:hypothetical protein
MLRGPEEIAFRSSWMTEISSRHWQKRWASVLAVSTYCAPAFQQILGAVGVRFHGCVCVTGLT